jgi:hypothetical protein
MRPALADKDRRRHGRRGCCQAAAVARAAGRECARQVERSGGWVQRPAADRGAAAPDWLGPELAAARRSEARQGPQRPWRREDAAGLRWPALARAGPAGPAAAKAGPCVERRVVAQAALAPAEMRRRAQPAAVNPVADAAAVRVSPGDRNLAAVAAPSRRCRAEDWGNSPPGSGIHARTCPMADQLMNRTTEACPRAWSQISHALPMPFSVSPERTA